MKDITYVHNFTPLVFDFQVCNKPLDPEDDSCGEPDRTHGHRNSNEREEDIRPIIFQLATYELLRKDTWPRQTVAAEGYEGAYPDRHG